MSDEDDGTVVPLRRGPAPPAPVGGLHRRTQRAARPAQELAAAHTAQDKERYAAAAIRQRNDRLLEHGRPVPARITLALDLRGLDGPEVDEACGTFEGNPAGDVDDWEDARAVPSGAQVEALSRLTGMPVAYFYLPIEVGPVLPGTWICWGGRRGCESPTDVVDERGVLLYEGKPRDPARTVQIGLFPAADVMADPGERVPRRASRSPASAAPVRKNTPAGAATPPAAEPLPIPRGRLRDEDRARLMERIQAGIEKHRP